MAHDMPESCELPSLDGCRKTFMLTHKEVDIAPHQVAGLVLQEETRKPFSHALCLENWIFFSVSKQGPCFTAIEQDGDDKKLELFFVDLMVLLSQIQLNLTIAAIAGAIRCGLLLVSSKSPPLTSGRSCQHPH